MPFRSRNYLKEFGSALAVLAIYLLVLLAPLHQAAGLQRDFNALGYVSLDTASICAALAQDENGQPVAKCAVAGIGKNEVVLVEAAAIDIDVPLVASIIRYEPDATALTSTLDYHPGRPRAPPVVV